MYIKAESGKLVNENCTVHKLLFFQKNTCMPWTQKFDKAHENKYQNNFQSSTIFNNYPQTTKTSSTWDKK